MHIQNKKKKKNKGEGEGRRPASNKTATAQENDGQADILVWTGCNHFALCEEDYIIVGRRAIKSEPKIVWVDGGWVDVVLGVQEEKCKLSRSVSQPVIWLVYRPSRKSEEECNEVCGL